MIPAVASPPSESRSTTPTFAPDFAKASAVARPMPFPAPVISATLPVKSISTASSFIAQQADSLRPHLPLHKLPPQGAPRTLAGRLAPGPYRAAVDKDMLDPGGRPGRLGEGGAVDDGLRVEDAEIGIGAGAHDSAPAEAEPRRPQPGHLLPRGL